jgi:hypothetical protein
MAGRFRENEISRRFMSMLQRGESLLAAVLPLRCNAFLTFKKAASA